MKFKSFENNLIWENYSNQAPHFNETLDDELNPFEGEEDTAVISLEPVGELEVDEFEDHSGCDCDHDDQTNEVVFSDVKKLAEYSKRLMEVCKTQKLEPWMQAKIIRASDYISDVWHRLDASADFANDQHPDLEM